MSFSKFAVTLVCGSISGFAASPLTNLARPLSFEPNRGQADQQVEFLAHGLNYNLFVSQGEAVIIAGHEVVRMQAVAANRATRGELIDPLPGISNYFIGGDAAKWRTNVPTYSKIRYADVYPSVDLIYYGNQRQLEYDFVVQPGGDPRVISLQLESKAPPKLNSDGELVLHTAAGDLTWHKPVAYQEIGGKREAVHCAYLRKGKRLAFEVGAYDRTKPLVIDPVIAYSTYLGGSGSDSGNGLAVDANGSAYIVGSTGSVDFPTKDPLQANNGDNTNAFVTKFDAAGGALVYSTYLGGSGGAQANGIAVDKSGNAYVTGWAFSGFPTKSAVQTQNNCTKCIAYGNAFVAKLGPKGAALIYSTYIGGSGVPNGQDSPYYIGDTGNGITVDSSGNAYLTGMAASTDFPTKNALQNSNSCSQSYYCSNTFVAKFEGTGALVYSTYLDGTPLLGYFLDGGNGIAVDSSGSAYVTGATSSANFPTKNAFQNVNKAAPSWNAFVTKLSPAGNALVYSTYLGGSGGLSSDGCCYVGDSGSGIAVDAGGHAYVTGETRSYDFPVANAFQKTTRCGGRCSNAFVTKFKPGGATVVYSTYLGGTGYEDFEGVCEETGCFYGDFGNAIATDQNGDAYITGATISTDFPIKNAFESMLDKGQPNTTYNAFVTKFCPAGTLLYSSYLGSSGRPFGDSGNGIAVDAAESAYVTGYTGATDFPTKDAFQKKNKAAGRGYNGFVTKISAK